MQRLLLDQLDGLLVDPLERHVPLHRVHVDLEPVVDLAQARRVVLGGGLAVGRGLVLRWQHAALAVVEPLLLVEEAEHVLLAQLSL